MTVTSENYFSKKSKNFSNNYSGKKQFADRVEIFCSLANKYIPTGSIVLDLGCGPGIISIYIASLGYKIIGIDSSEEMIINANKHKTVSKSESVEFIKSRIPEDLSVLDNYIPFNGIICSSVLEYIKKLDETLSFTVNLLHPSSYFIVSMPNFKSLFRRLELLIFKLTKRPEYYNYIVNRLSLESFVQKVEKNGYKLVEVRYYSTKYLFFRLLDNILPASHSGNMFVCVFQKKT